MIAKSVDMTGGVAVLRYYAGWADKLQGKTVPVDGDYFVYTVLDPGMLIGCSALVNNVICCHLEC